MEPIPTVRVKTDAVDNPDGYFVMNESDFDPAVHEKFEGEVATLPPPGDVVTPPPAPKKGIGELRAYLDSKDIAYPADAKKADLQALYDADMGV